MESNLTKQDLELIDKLVEGKLKHYNLIVPIEQVEQPKEEVKEAKRLIEKFGSYATDVAIELKLNDQYNNTYFWECVTIEIDKINANKAL